MIFQIFTSLLSYKLTRKMLLHIKRCCLANGLPVAMIKEWKQKDFIYQNNTINLIGHNSLQQFPIIVNKWKFTNALIITDPILIKTGVVKQVTEQLQKLKIQYAIFEGVVPNPTIKVVQEITNFYLASKCDALISIGGGSAHDAMKAASLLLTNDCKEVRKYQGLNVTKNAPTMPIIAINTTAGTGSGTTNVAVITDEASHTKMTLVDKNIQPHVIIDDSNLMIGLPPKPSTWVGVDTLVHALEAYLSPVQNIIIQTYAKRTIQLVLQYLPIIYKEPSNIEAREKLAYAEFLGGSAFNCASLGFVHSLSHALSGTFNTPHGLANALILPYVLDYEINNEIVIEKLCEISEFLNIGGHMSTSIDKAKIFLSYLITFLRKLNIPTKLAEVQPTFTKKQLVSMCKKAMRDFCGISNPVQFSRNEVLHIYQNIINGKFENIKYEENS